MRCRSDGILQYASPARGATRMGVSPAPCRSGAECGAWRVPGSQITLNHTALHCSRNPACWQSQHAVTPRARRISLRHVQQSAEQLHTPLSSLCNPQHGQARFSAHDRTPSPHRVSLTSPHHRFGCPLALGSLETHRSSAVRAHPHRHNCCGRSAVVAERCARRAQEGGVGRTAQRRSCTASPAR